MEAVPVPVINHILCVSMKFHFLCDVLRGQRLLVEVGGAPGHISLMTSFAPPPPVMTPWCREQLPVEGNFGQLFDKLNVSVQQLSSEFNAQLSLQVS